MSSEQGNTTTPAPASGNSNGNSNNNNNNSRTRRNQSNTQPTDSNSFEGNVPEIGAVLGLKYEKFKKKSASFEIFLEKVSVYVISNLNDGGDCKLIFRKMQNPTKTFRAKYKPSAPTESSDTVDKDIYKEEVKLFVSREINLRRNIEKIFGLVWGQCSSALQSNIKAISEFEDKYDDLDTIWLVQELKNQHPG